MKWVRKIRAEWIAAPVLLAAMIAAWNFYCARFHVSPFILPPPGAVWSAFVDRDPGALTKGRPTLARFDYLLLVGLKPFQVPVDAALTLVGETATFKLFEVRKAGTF